MAKTYRRILIPTDFSAGSRAALRHLEVVCASGTGYRVHLVHVLEPLPFIVPPAPVIGFEEARRLIAPHDTAQGPSIPITLALRPLLGLAPPPHAPAAGARAARAEEPLQVVPAIRGHGNDARPHPEISSSTKGRDAGGASA